MENITDEQFKLFKMGNEPAFNKIYYDHYNSIEYYSRNFIKDRKEAEDIAMSTLASLWRNRENIECKEMIKPFLYRVAKNRCIDYIRNRNKHKTGLETLARHQKTKEVDFSLMQEEAETIKELKKELYKSGDRSLIAARLSFLEGEKNAEIAEQLNTTANNISHLKKQAIAQLRKLLNLILCSGILIILSNSPHLSKKISHLVSLFHDFIVFLTR